ncbi:Kynurenine formamidase [Actinomortierella ambigua]|nr:Kynurenine formamidase [Actinomortierella ambigua]
MPVDLQSITVHRDLVYAPVSDWEKHTFDLYVPAGASQAPLIVFVHGGAWRTGDKSMFTNMATGIAAATGNTVAVVNYTLSLAAIPDDPLSVPTKAQHPKHPMDVAAAIVHLYAEADKYNAYDRNRIYLSGHSVGAQLTGLMVLRPNDYLIPAGVAAGLPDPKAVHRAIKGVIGVDGIYEVDKLWDQYPDYRGFIKQAFAESRERRLHGSPQGQSVKDQGEDFKLPLYAVIHSFDDELLDDVQSKGYFAYLQSIVGTLDTSRVQLEFGHWGKHDELLQTDQFPKTVAKYIHVWEKGSH